MEEQLDVLRTRSMKTALIMIGAVVGYFSFVGYWVGLLAAAVAGIGLIWVPRARALGVGLLLGLATFSTSMAILVWNLSQLDQ